MYIHIRSVSECGERLATRVAADALDLSEEFWDDAEIKTPAAKQAVSLRVDPKSWNFSKPRAAGI
jgi:hypothetical protein